MSPAAAELVRSLQKQKDVDGLWDALDSLPSGRESWSDLTDCVMEIRNQQNWLLVIQVNFDLLFLDAVDVRSMPHPIHDCESLGRLSSLTLV